MPSRRFGRSLGIDLLPYKTCSLDCIFCQLGRTTQKTLGRKEYVPTGEVISELDDWLTLDGKADYITLSGSGEPTLHSKFGEVIKFLRSRTSIPVLLLTNGTLLYRPEVRKAASLATVVKVSLGAWNDDSFRKLNRPCQNLHFSQLLEGENKFRSEFKGKLFLEVFLVDKVNSAVADVSKIAKLAQGIQPDRVQLNTAVRPPAEGFVVPLTKEKMQKLARLFKTPVEIIAEFSSTMASDIKANEKTIFAMLRRRPCTMEQVADVFSMHINEVSKYIGKLLRTGKIQAENRAGKVYYFSGGMSKKE